MVRLQRPLLPLVLAIAGLLALSAVMALVLPGEQAQLQAHQLPGTPSGAQQLHDTVTNTLNQVGAPQGTDQRALQDSVAQGYIDAIPPNAPQPSLAYTSALQSVVTGALSGASPDLAAGMDSGQRSLVQADAQGFATSLFAGLPANPSSTQGLILQAIAEGMTAGAARAADDHPQHRAADYQAWAQNVANHVVGWSQSQAQQLPAPPIGGQVSALQAWAEGLSDGALGAMPNPPAQQQLTALGDWAGAFLQQAEGNVLGGGVPTSVPTPLLDAMQAYATGVGQGGTDGMPTQGPVNADAFVAYMTALATGMPERIASLDTTPTQSGIDFLQAWGQGLAHDAPTWVDPNGFTKSGDVGKAVRTYGQRLANDGADLMQNASGWGPDRIAAAQAWAQALGDGARNIGAGGAQDTAALNAWVDGLAGAVQQFPPLPYQDQVDAMSAFGKGAALAGADVLTRNAQNIAQPPSPDFVSAVAQGIRDGAAILGVQTPAPDPGLVENFSQGLVNGSISPGNPFAFERNATQGARAVTQYLNGSTEGALGGLYRDAWRDVTDGGSIVLAAANAMTAPEWSFLNDRIDRGQLGGSEAHAWGNATANGMVTALMNAKNRIVKGTPQQTVAGVEYELLRWKNGLKPSLDHYVAGVLAKAYPPPDLRNLSAENTTKAVTAFAGILTQPIQWLPSIDPSNPDVDNQYTENVSAFIGHIQRDSQAFLDEANVHGLDALVNGTSKAIADGVNATRYASDQGNATQAWVAGLGDAITHAPLPAVNPDIEAYRSWAENVTLGAVGAVSNGTFDQLNETQRLANQTLQRVLNGTPPGLPPLLVADWAQAYVNSTIHGLPDLMVQQQEDAILKWANGTLAAITNPPLDPAKLSKAEMDAATAYVTAVSEAAGHVPPGPNPGSIDPGSISDAYLNAAMNATVALRPTTDQLDSIQAWANATAFGFAAMAGPHAQAALDFVGHVMNGTPPALPGPREVAILGAYANGLMKGINDTAGLYVPSPDPGQPPHVPDPRDWQQVNAFIDGVQSALQDLRNLSLPKDPPFAGQVDRVDNLTHFAVFGGIDAIWATHDAFTGDSEAVTLWAQAYLDEGQRTVVQPLVMDEPAMQQYVEGSAHEGVTRILALKDLPASQLPAVQAYAQAVANMSKDQLFHTLGSNSTDWYNYAADLTTALQQVPTQPTTDQLHAMQLWLGVVRDAATNLSTAPSQQAADNVRTWIAAEADAIVHGAPPGPPVNMTPQQWQDYLNATGAYLDGLTSSGLWDLANVPPGPNPLDDAAWVRDSVLAAITGACTTELPETCAEAERIAGSATGHDIVRDARNLTDPSHFPDAQQVHDTLVAAAQGVLDQVPAPTPGQAIAIVTGAAQPLLQQVPGGNPAQGTLDAVLAAANATAANVPGTLADPAGAAQAIAQSIAQQLPLVQPPPSDPGQLRGWAMASAHAAGAWLVAHGAPADPAALLDQVQQVVGATLGTAPNTLGVQPSVTMQATDGSNTLGDAQLDGTRSLRADVADTLTVAIPPTADPPQAVWTAAVSLGAFDMGTAHKVALTKGAQGYQAQLAADLLHQAADGTVLHVEVVRTVGGVDTPFTRDGQPWAYKLDQAPPTFQLTVPAAPSAAQFALTWAAGDGNGAGVQGVWVDVQRDGGDWSHVVQGTQDTGASFQGEAGHAYTFRGWAEDLVGHATQPVQQVATVPASAGGTGGSGGPNHAPTIQLLDAPSAPQRGVVTLHVRAADVDGTTPTLTASLVPGAGRAVVLYSGTASALPLDTRLAPDGAYTLRVEANDGSLRAHADAPFRVLNHGPQLAGPKPAPSPSGGVLMIVEGGEATQVLLTLQQQGSNGVLSQPMHDDATHGDDLAGDHTYVAELFGLQPGTYLATVTATDAAGNTATHISDVQVPPPYTPPTVPIPVAPLPSAPPGGGAPLPPPGPAGKGFLGLPGFEPLLAALAVAGVAVLRRKR